MSFRRFLFLPKQGTNCICVSLHPGAARTKLTDNLFVEAKKNIFSSLLLITYPLWLIITKSSKEAAQTSIYLAVADFAELSKYNGFYFRCDLNYYLINL